MNHQWYQIIPDLWYCRDWDVYRAREGWRVAPASDPSPLPPCFSSAEEAMRHVDPRSPS